MVSGILHMKLALASTIADIIPGQLTIHLLKDQAKPESQSTGTDSSRMPGTPRSNSKRPSGWESSDRGQPIWKSIATEAPQTKTRRGRWSGRCCSRWCSCPDLRAACRKWPARCFHGRAAGRRRSRRRRDRFSSQSRQFQLVLQSAMPQGGFIPSGRFSSLPPRSTQSTDPSDGFPHTQGSAYRSEDPQSCQRYCQ